MSDEVQSSGWSKVLYFLTGLSVGAVVTALFAPKSGDETRRDLSKHAEKLKHKATEIVEQGRDTVAEKKDQITAALETGREVYKSEVAKAKGAGSETQS